MEDKLLSVQSRINKKQIHLWIPEYLHKEIRMAAAIKGISIMQFCISSVLEQLQAIKAN